MKYVIMQIDVLEGDCGEPIEYRQPVWVGHDAEIAMDKLDSLRKSSSDILFFECIVERK